MKLYVARHPQTNYNVRQILNDDPRVDVHLTDAGIEQAKELARKLHSVQFDAIFISELPRTRETASYLEQYSTTPVVTDNRLHENRSGFDGRPVQEYLEAFMAQTDRWHAVLNGGESLANVKRRTADFLEDLKTKPYDTVLVITHGFVVECINGIINNLDFELAATFEIPQGSYDVYSL